jgi:hypothetical protein
MALAIMSVDPPAGNGTTIVTGLSGQAIALDIVIAAAIEQRILFMSVSCD